MITSEPKVLAVTGLSEQLGLIWVGREAPFQN